MPYFREKKIKKLKKPIGRAGLVCYNTRNKAICRILKKEGIFLKKADFIKETAAKAKVSQKEAQAVTAAAIEVIKGALKKGDTVPFLGFGTFKISNRAARMGRNPQTGAEIKIPAAKLPTFKASPAFKDFVNSKKAAPAKKAAKKKK